MTTMDEAVNLLRSNGYNVIEYTPGYVVAPDIISPQLIVEFPRSMGRLTTPRLWCCNKTRKDDVIQHTFTLKFSFTKTTNRSAPELEEILERRYYSFYHWLLHNVIKL